MTENHIDEHKPLVYHKKLILFKEHKHREPVYDFLLVITSNLGRLAPLLRYSDLLAKTHQFFHPPPPHLAPSFGVTPFEFMGKLYGS